MTLVRRVARPMLAAIFVVQGLEQLRHPSALNAKSFKWLRVRTSIHHTPPFVSLFNWLPMTPGTKMRFLGASRDKRFRSSFAASAWNSPYAVSPRYDRIAGSARPCLIIVRS